MKRQLLWLAVCLLVVAVPPSARSAAAADPTAVVNSLGNEALKVLGKDVDPNLRVTRFRELFNEDFNVAGLSRFVLGRYWRLATPQQQQEFVKVFTNYVALAYANRLAEYSGETLRVIGSRAAPDGQLVSSEIVRTNGQPPAHVDWLMTSENGAYKISDVIVQGVSMAVTQRSEFASVIQRNGGQVQGLITALRQKTENAGMH